MFRFPFAHTARVATFLVVAACDIVASGPQQVVVLNGTFHVAAPSGYCVDTKASQGRADTAVVLIGRCTAGGQVAAALVSVTIGKSASGGAILAGPAVLGQYFASPDGRRALARDGKPDHVQVVATAAAEGTLYLHLNDLIAGEYWRAITTV
ncbi:MAG: hypothetical protein ABIV25_10445, partial [Paracoccaceae bacterium]